jgi:hypothetical protein
MNVRKEMAVALMRGSFFDGRNPAGRIPVDKTVWEIFL